VGALHVRQSISINGLFIHTEMLRIASKQQSLHRDLWKWSTETSNAGEQTSTPIPDSGGHGSDMYLITISIADKLTKVNSMVGCSSKHHENKMKSKQTSRIVCEPVTEHEWRSTWGPSFRPKPPPLTHISYIQKSIDLNQSRDRHR
jgi:hypothetical protein